MSQKLQFQVLIGLFLFLCFCYSAKAQLSLTGQLRTRTEFRDGYATLNTKGSPASIFTSQRTRLTLAYKWDKVNFQTSVQDIRLWGQDASTINNADGNRFMVHEAWAEIFVANAADSTFKWKGIEKLSFKLGRQALIYDDVRLLGDLDWLQQPRRHDALVIKALHKGWQLDLGFGFNQSTDAFGATGTTYTSANVPGFIKTNKGYLVNTPNNFIPLTDPKNGNSSKNGNAAFANVPSTNAINQQYKSMQFLYVARKFGKTKFAGLFFKDDFSKYIKDSSQYFTGKDTSYVYGLNFNNQTGVNSRITYGLMINGLFGNENDANRIIWQAGAYFQGGKDKEGKNLNAAHFTISALATIGKFSFGPGFDYLSGNDGTSTLKTNNRFDPLYGTPHKFWGYMDYFYVGTVSPVGGLQNAYFKTRYSTKNLFITFDIHNFALAKPTINNSDVAKPQISKNLGYEFDLLVNYSLNKITNIEAGYCFMTATNSMEYIKKGTMGKTNHIPQWAYLMINIRPDFLNKNKK